MFEAFLKHFDLDKSMKKFTQFLNFLSYRYDLEFNAIMELFNDFVKEEKHKLSDSTIEDDYKTFLDNNEDTLESDFNTLFNFQTSTRGLKVRGVFPTQEEAELRCKLLREADPNHDIYVGPVGTWIPWEPKAYKTGRVEYIEEELNQIMHEKQKSEASAKEDFHSRVRDSKRKAIEENIRKARETGNKLTQNIDENDQLVGAEGGSSVESALADRGEITSADIRRELFENKTTRIKEHNNKKK
jgi:hypothetical protein